MSVFEALALMLSLAIGLLAGCDGTDAATRIAFDLEHHSRALRASGETSLGFTHNPKSAPDGVTGPYTVTFKAGPMGAAKGSGYLSFSKGSQEVWHHTGYHLHYVEVRKDLKISKAQGEPLIIVLARIENSVLVIDLR